MMQIQAVMKRSLLIISLLFAFALSQAGFSHAFQTGQSDIQQLKAFSNAFVQIAKNVRPAVVSIQATKIITIQRSRGGRSNDEIDDFWRRLLPQGRGEFEQQGLGSGVIIDKDGYILTNNHVVESTVEITVRLQDKRSYKAELIGTDPRTDIALIKVDGENLPVAKFGDSSKLQVGEWVVAIGTPLNETLNSTVTAGIVSALGRRLNIINPSFNIEDFIQTDAAINPGNSGGPLLNLDGEIVGINTAIMSNTGSYQGYGFAIPSNLVKNIVEDLRASGKVIRGVLGVNFQEIQDQNVMKELKLQNPYGVIVTGFAEEFFTESPAKKAGVKEKDVIVAINDMRFERGGQLQTLLAGKNPGEQIKLTVIRDGAQKDIWVTLGELPEEVVETPVALETYSVPEIGIDVIENESSGRRSQIQPRGVQISRVRRNFEGDRKNLKIGDIVFKIETMEINSLEDFQNAIERYRNQERVTFYIRNDEGTHLINIRLHP